MHEQTAKPRPTAWLRLGTAWRGRHRRSDGKCTVPAKVLRRVLLRAGRVLQGIDPWTSRMHASSSNMSAHATLPDATTKLAMLFDLDISNSSLDEPPPASENPILSTRRGAQTAGSLEKNDSQ